MLDSKQTYQISLQNVAMLENRIKRLQYEEDRAKKITELANEKAEKLLKARERHQKEVEFKFFIQNMKKQQEEQLKLTNRN